MAQSTNNTNFRIPLYSNSGCCYLCCGSFGSAKGETPFHRAREGAEMNTYKAIAVATILMLLAAISVSVWEAAIIKQENANMQLLRDDREAVLRHCYYGCLAVRPRSFWNAYTILNENVKGGIVYLSGDLAIGNSVKEPQ